MARKRYGLETHPLYVTHRNMIRRCTNPADNDYPMYGGRGITVCGRWLGSDGLTNFADDMGMKQPGQSLDRIDNAKGYSPDNCRWANAREQSLNTRKNNGHSNVYWSKHRQKWYVQFYMDGKRIGKGGISTLEEAINVRDDLQVMIYGVR